MNLAWPSSSAVVMVSSLRSASPPVYSPWTSPCRLTQQDPSLPSGAQSVQQIDEISEQSGASAFPTLTNVPTPNHQKPAPADSLRGSNRLVSMMVSAGEVMAAFGSPG